MAKVIGIDGGQTGACSALRDGGLPRIWPLPIKFKHLDVVKFAAQLQSEKPIDLLVVEKVYVPDLQSMIRLNRSPYSIAQLWKIAFEVQAVCDLLGINVHPPVPAQTWKSRILIGMDWRKNKKASVQYVQQRWPEISLRRTPRCKTDWIDAADAICIARWLMIYGK